MNKALDEVRREMDKLAMEGLEPDYPKILESLTGNSEKIKETRRQYINDWAMGRLDR